MTDWNTIKCYECRGHCNKKGYPSVTKGSKHCKQERGLLPLKKDDRGIMAKIKMMFMNKGRMRSSGTDMKGDYYD